MGKLNNLKKIVDILRDNFEDEMVRDGDWTWNLRHWTINFVTDPDHESVIAYKVKDGRTDWSEYITLESRSKVWREFV